MLVIGWSCVQDRADANKLECTNPLLTAGKRAYIAKLIEENTKGESSSGSVRTAGDFADLLKSVAGCVLLCTVLMDSKACLPWYQASRA